MRGESASSLLLVALALLATAQLSCADQDVNYDYGAVGANRTTASSRLGPHEHGGVVTVGSAAPNVSDKTTDDREERLQYDSGKTNNLRRVYGGEKAKLGDFTALVFIKQTYTYTERGLPYDGASSNCTGTIISPTWVMTAAHCLPVPYLYTYCFPKQDGRYSDVDVRIEVTAGSVDLFANAQPTAVTLSVAHPAVNNKHIVVHEDVVWFRKNDPEYPRFFYDIALLRMSGAFPTTDAIGPIALMSGAMPAMFPQRCTSLGFGKNAEAGNARGLAVTDGKLRYNLVTVGGVDFCKNITRAKKWRDKQFICTHNAVDGRQMSCVGDSGSPLLCGTSDRRVAAGVLSGSQNGGACGEDAPDDEYTFTGLVEKWVKNVTNNEAKFSPLPVRSITRRRGGDRTDCGHRMTAPITLGLVLGSVFLVTL